VAHEKNIDFLLDVLAEVHSKVPDILLVIAGEGPARKSLQARVERDAMQRHVLFVDYLPRGEPLWDCFCAGDAFIFASSTETQGLVLLEAMALGVPVVSTAVMGTRDILEAGKGGLVAEQETGDFGRKVMRLLGNEELRLRLGAEAKAYAGEWSAGEMADRLVIFYQGLLNKPLPATVGDANVTR
jgi:glycosyltransferase involved in cell wall biosynthesis